MSNKYQLPNQARIFQNWVGGTWKPSASGKTFNRISPGHGQEVGQYPLSQEEDTIEAIQVAKASFEQGLWKDMSGIDRSKIVGRVAEIIRQRSEELALIECLESGKPISQAQDEMEWAAGIWDFAATMCRHIQGGANTNLGPDMTVMTIKEPAGVVGMITPWNFPLLIISQKLPFALAAGCSAVIKPSEMTPGTTLLLGEICQQAGVPDGVVNVLSGYGNPVGTTLSSHADIDMVTFTGSTQVGRMIAKSAADTLKKVELELGGKNPQLVFPDADLDVLVDAVVFGIFFNMGECCNSGSRIIIHESLKEAFVEKVVAHAKKMKFGDPLDPTVKMGAIINQQQCDKIMHYIHSGEEQGARLVLGGRKLDTPDGLFIEPTIFADVSPEMDIAKEEIFGPVLSVITFSTTEEAIAIANGTEFGLSSGVWTKDINTAMMVSRKIVAGTVWINNWMSGFPEVPFGGMKQSGLGRELGVHSVDEYLETKSILIQTNPTAGNWTTGE
ncbi:aldehyde dehydrogenase family protein [Persicobacter psychrovividus]|uniref:Aldehyde dehydrogenase n=1 Tax=Persicobacter psychrovividus TaxID=387638 RepID=A0ABM7VCT3_9BACT|nr:aldehyde dehydrogenase [Persicobacter psychrovividus]